MTFHTFLRRKHLLVVIAIVCACSASATAGQFVYVVNGALNVSTVSVIDAADNTLVATVPVEFAPEGIAITPNGRYAYVTGATGKLSVISTATNTVIATIPVGCFLLQVAIAPDGKHAYTTDVCGNLTAIDIATNMVTASIEVSRFDTLGVAISPDSSRAYVTTLDSKLFVIDTTSTTIAAGPIPFPGDVNFPNGVAVAPDGKVVYVAGDALFLFDAATNALIASVPLVAGSTPWGLAVTPDGQRLYVTSYDQEGFVSVIDVALRTIIANIVVDDFPFGVAISLDGRLAYVTNQGSDTVSVIDTTANLVLASIDSLDGPLGVAVAPFTFAGTLGKPNCHGESVSALAREFGGLPKAAASLGFSSVQALQSAIRTFCEE